MKHPVESVGPERNAVPQSAASNLTIPNLLSGLRIASVPLLVFLAWSGQHKLFIICLTISLATDLLDGLLARLLKQETALGATLDLWGDAGVFLSLPLAFWWLWPDILSNERWFIGTTVASYAVSASFALWKFGGLANYHTWLGKTANVGLSVGALVAMLGWAPWLFRAGILLMNAAIFEELAIPLILRERRINLASWWHARRLAASAGKSPGNRKAKLR